MSRRRAATKRDVLPDHKYKYTSVNYMKEIISGARSFFYLYQIKFVSVPFYLECSPENVIKSWGLKEQKQIF